MRALLLLVLACACGDDVIDGGSPGGQGGSGGSVEDGGGGAGGAPDDGCDFVLGLGEDEFVAAEDGQRVPMVRAPDGQPLPGYSQHIWLAARFRGYEGTALKPDVRYEFDFVDDAGSMDPQAYCAPVDAPVDGVRTLTRIFGFVPDAYLERIEGKPIRIRVRAWSHADILDCAGPPANARCDLTREIAVVPYFP